MGYSLARAASGILRIDYAVTSVIVNPATLQMIILDHLKLEVQSIIMPKPPVLWWQALPPIPGMPPISPLAAAAMIAVNLGIRIIAGQEVQGMQYTLPPLVPPKPPQIQLPGMPPLPPPPKPLVAEVWLSTALQLSGTDENHRTVWAADVPLRQRRRRRAAAPADVPDPGEL